jgi:hypothetical protein
MTFIASIANYNLQLLPGLLVRLLFIFISILHFPVYTVIFPSFSVLQTRITSSLSLLIVCLFLIIVFLCL